MNYFISRVLYLLVVFVVAVSGIFVLVNNMPGDPAYGLAVSIAQQRNVPFDRALEKFPDDPEVLSATAALHLRGPEDYGANRALARQCLEKLSAIEGWLMVSKALARELREDAA